MLNQLKILLSLSDDQMPYAEFALGKATDLICNYCNVSAVPDGLRRVCVSIAMDIYRMENFGSEEAGLTVKSITEGNVSTSFETKGRITSGADEGAYITPYIKQLQRFRRF